MTNGRDKIPKAIEDEILFQSRHTCNICRIHGKDVQIHHIDGDRNNNAYPNLIVLCLDHHSKVTAKSLGKSYTKGELRRYKDEWETIVRLTANPERIVTDLFQPDAISRFKPLLDDLTKHQSIAPQQEIVNQSSNSTRSEVPEGKVTEADKHKMQLRKELHYIHTLVSYLFDKKDYPKVVEILDHLLESDPQNREYALSNKARALINLSRFDEAISITNDLLKNNPTDVQNMLFMSYLLYRNEKYDKSISYADKILQLDADNDFALALKGDSLVELGNYSEAMIIHEQLLKKDPLDSEALWHVGVIKCHTGKHEEALSFFKRSLKIEPANPHVLFSIGLEYQHLGKFDDALRYFEESFKVDPSSKSLEAKGSLLSESFNKHNEALSCFMGTLEMNPKDAKLLYAIGLEFSYIGDQQRSLEYYDKALSIDPDNTSALINKAAALIDDLDKPEEGLILLERALRLQPYHEIALQNKKIALRKINARNK